ncbi:MAG TPA: septum site-determining protein Ssd [Actinomycetes bacterium]|nr:septum site-determining protein Ssd [Actinomycetes bacterium]
MLIADNDLLDDVLRASAAASVPVEVVPDPGAARRAWSDAPLVVVGDDTAAAVAQVGLPRRSGVVLVGREPPDPDIWQRGLQVGAEDVVFVPEADEWLANRLADAAEGEVRTGALICVVGGRGGAGASTLAAGLAVSGTRRGLSCLLVDADPLGGGLDLALGYENTDGLRWPQLAESRGRISAAALQHALPTGPSRRGSRLPSLGAVPLPLISCDRTDLADVPADGMAAILDAGLRGADLVIVDLPRCRSAAGEVALARSTVTLLVVPAEVRATAAAGRVAELVAVSATDVRLVVRGSGPSRLRGEVIAQSLGLPLVGEMAPDPDIGADLDRGLPPARTGRGPLAEMCHHLIGELVFRSRGAA